MGEVGQALLQERLALHEVLRVGLAREDDLKLLQQVAQAQLELPPASLQQLFKEVSLREEWRMGREQQLLQQLQASTLTCVQGRDVSHIQHLAQQVQQMQLRQAQAGRAQLHRHQQLPSPAAPSRTYHSPTCMVPADNTAAGSTPSQQPIPLSHIAGTQSSLTAALSIYQGSKVSKAAGMSAVVHGAVSSKAGIRPGALTADPGRPVAQRSSTRVSSTGSGAAPASTGAEVVPAHGPAAERDGVKLLRASSGAVRSNKERTAAAGRFSRVSSNPREQQQHLPQLLTADQLRQQLLQHTHSNQASVTASSGGESTGLAVRHSIDATNTQGCGYTDKGRAGITSRRSVGDVASSAPREGGVKGHVGVTSRHLAGDAAATGVSMASTAALKQRTASQPVFPSQDRPATAPVPSSGTATQPEPVRFQKLLHLQGMLLTGLQQHVEGGGVAAACAALVDSLQHMQQHFAACLAEAQRLAYEAAGNPPSPQIGHARSVAGWGRLLLLGQLALSPADTVRLSQLRQHIAARSIQRAVRRYLRRQHAAAVTKEAAAKAAAAAHRLRSHAALVVQRYWRGYLGRKAAHKHAIQAVKDRRQRALLRARRLLAAMRIQKWWRRHVKQRRAMHALKLPVSDHAAQTVRHLGLGVSTGSTCMTLEPQQQQFNSTQAKGTQQQQDRVLRGIVRFQALVRGWLVRRSVGLWWSRSVAQLRRARMAARGWRAHQAYLVDALPLQEQYIASLEAEEQVAQAAMQAAHKEQAVMEMAWDAWLHKQLTIALAQPLPRGWVRHTPTQGYLDTRTGALHTHHPAELQLHSFAAAQHEAAVGQLQRSLSALQQRVAQQQAMGSQQRNALFAGMYECMVAHLRID